MRRLPLHLEFSPRPGCAVIGTRAPASAEVRGSGEDTPFADGYSGAGLDVTHGRVVRGSGVSTFNGARRRTPTAVTHAEEIESEWP